MAVYVNVAAEVDEEEVLGEGIIETQEGETQYTVALRDDEEDTMQDMETGVEVGVGSWTPMRN